MLFMFLRKPIKARITPEHPHLVQLKSYKRTQWQGTGRWVCFGTVPPPNGVPQFKYPKLRRAYGRTQREAWLMYNNLYLTKPKG